MRFGTSTGKLASKSLAPVGNFGWLGCYGYSFMLDELEPALYVRSHLFPNGDSVAMMCQFNMTVSQANPQRNRFVCFLLLCELSRQLAEMKRHWNIQRPIWCNYFQRMWMRSGWKASFDLMMSRKRMCFKRICCFIVNKYFQTRMIMRRRKTRARTKGRKRRCRK